MSALSIFKSDRTTIILAANPIFLTSPLRTASGAEVTFEVFQVNAHRLQALIGSKQLYSLDHQLFWAELKSLQPSESTHPGLARLRDKPTLRGVFLMHGDHYNA
jgi:hypothetical protein